MGFAKLALILMLAPLALVLAAYPVAKSTLAARIHADLEADLAWLHVDGPASKTTRAYFWYPLTYPVLERWSLSNDGSRQHYAIATIEHFGGPMGRRWLDDLIDANPSDGYQIIPFESGPASEFALATGLDEPSAREAAANRAIAHFGKHPYDVAFDDRLLEMFGPDALPALERWANTAAPDRLDRLYAAMPRNDDGLSAEQIARYARLKRLADAARDRNDAKNRMPPPTPGPNRAIDDAIVALNHGDKRALEVLRPAVDGDLRHFDDNGWDANLIAVANAFPNSRFAKGCRAYDALRGSTYFGREDRFDAPYFVGPVAGWRAWLAAYPDHPGADDAAYWLGRALQRQGDDLGAAWAYANALEGHFGDGDMQHALWVRLTFMLDEGLDDAELDTFARVHATSRFAPFARYASAVRRARANDFTGALEISKTIDFASAVRQTSGIVQYYKTAWVIQAYDDQRARWRRLAAAVPSLTKATHRQLDRLADAWSDDDGWNIGYLVLFQTIGRNGGNIDLNDPLFLSETIRKNAQAASQNAQVIALAKPLTRASLPAEIRKRNQRRLVIALYRQQTEYYDNETYVMGSLPSLPSSVGYDSALFTGFPPTKTDDLMYYRQELRESRIAAWWARQSIVEGEAFAADYPDDAFASTALLAAYEVSGSEKILHQIIDRYPNGPRTEEARAFLWDLTKPNR